MAEVEIPWKLRPANTPPSTIYPFLVIGASTFAKCLEEPKQAPFLVQMAMEKVNDELPKRHREEEDQSDKVALKWCWNRLRYDRMNLRILRTAIYEQAATQPAPLGPALQDLARLVETIIREADAANDRAPQMNPAYGKAKDVEELPTIKLPQSAATTPKNINYSSLIEQGNERDE